MIGSDANHNCKHFGTLSRTTLEGAATRKVMILKIKTNKSENSGGINKANFMAHAV